MEIFPSRKLKLILSAVILILAGFSALGVFYIFSRPEAKTEFSHPSSLEFGEADLELAQIIGFESSDDLKRWKVHEFNGRSHETLITGESGDHVLEMESHGTSSLLLKEANMPVGARPHLSWEWKVNEFPAGKTYSEFAPKSENDSAARVYAVFKGLTPFTSDTIQYTWDDHFPVGTYRTSPVAGHVKLLVVRSGNDTNGSWAREVRDVAKDYEMLFGKKSSSPLHAVGLMSDSDATRSSSRAQFKNIRLYTPRGMKESAAPESPVHKAIFSFGERLLFLRKADDVGISFARKSRDNIFGAFVKIRDAARSRFRLSRS